MMGDKITRRDFLKMAGMGSAAAALLIGCGSTTRAIHRKLYGDAPESPATAKSTCYATTCGECPVCCGLIVHTARGCVQRVEGNPAHPVNHGNICTKSKAILGSLYSPSRIRGPLRQSSRGSGSFTPIDWKTAIIVVQDALQKYAPGEIAFLLGLFPDHLNDLVQLLSQAMGGINVLRYSASSELEGRVTLMDATQKLFGAWKIPYFDVDRAELIFSFGANFCESWLPPAVRKKNSKRHRHLVQLGPRLPETADDVEKWLPTRCGNEAILARALAFLVSELTSGDNLPAFAKVDLGQAAETSGVPVVEMKNLARLFAQAPHKVAFPGNIPLGNTNGLEVAQSILALNVASGNLGKVGGIFLPPDSLVYPELSSRPNTVAEVAALVERMHQGQVKAILIHGVNPIHDLPQSFGFGEALRNVELVVSFASSLDETTMQADYLLPDHNLLEGWGYQRVVPGEDRLMVSAVQPAISPLYDTRSTTDLLLSAVRAVNSEVNTTLLYANTLDFVQKSLTPLIKQGGFFTDSAPASFWTLWLQNGGWWEAATRLIPPVVCTSFDQPWNIRDAGIIGEEDHSFFLLPFLHAGSAIKARTFNPTSLEIPNAPARKKMNTQVEIHPEAMLELGLHNDDLVKITSSMGEIRAVVHEVSTIRPDTIAISQGTESSAYKSGSAEPRVNLLELLGKEQNESGDLAFAATRVKVSTA